MNLRTEQRRPGRAKLAGTKLAGTKLAGGVALVVAVCMALASCAGSSKTSNSSTGGSGGSAASGGAVTLKGGAGYDAGSKTFTVSNLNALSGPLGAAGIALTTGEKVYFQALNAKGGINGAYKVNLNSQDTQYNPQLAVPLYNRVKSDTALFSTIFGTPIVNTLLPRFKADNYVVVNSSTDGRLTTNPNLLPLATSSQINMINLAAYAADKLGQKNAVFCSVTVNDDLGKSNVQGIQYAVGALGLTFRDSVLVEEAPAASYTPQIQKLKSDGCQVVLLGTTTAQLPGLAAASAQLSFDAQWLGAANTWDPSDASSAITPYLQAHYLTASLGTNWNSDAAGMAALRAALSQYSPATKPSPYVETGYAWGILTAAVLAQAIKSGDVTPAGVLAASQATGTVDYQGLFPNADYGAPAARKSPLVTTVYKVDPSVPMGLTPVADSYTSPATAQYQQKP
jgi:ABC-type branched-subunit amino acid transport system substrate-binding protein